MEISIKKILKLKENLTRIMAENTGQSVEKVRKDIERDFWLDAQEAKKYGVIDKVL
jgi:ATP-dependent Clp protease protease subunit